MKIIRCKDYEDMSRKAAALFYSQIHMKPDCVLGLATGGTPVGTYKQLIKWYEEGDLDFSKVKSVNLDEYIGLDGDHDQSYRYFMNNNLFNHVNIDKANTNVPNGKAEDMTAEALRYEALIESLGGIDMQLLGIGNNGHIGFNEPADQLVGATHKTRLTESTIQANSRFFASADEVPKHALTMGIAPIMKAKKIIMLVSGKNKHAVLREMLSGVLTTQNPATFLNLHDDVTVVCDEDAYNG